MDRKYGPRRIDPRESFDPRNTYEDGVLNSDVRATPFEERTPCQQYLTLKQGLIQYFAGVAFLAFSLESCFNEEEQVEEPPPPVYESTVDCPTQKIDIE